MERIILDVNAGMLEFCLAAIPPPSLFPKYAEWRRLWRWQTLLPALGLVAVVVGGIRVLARFIGGGQW